MSQSQSDKRTCIFCRTGVVTREHVWPEWLAKEISARTKDLVYHAFRGNEDVVRDTPVLDGVVKRVCKSCNEGWMSDLETESKPILLPLVFGDKPNVQLSPNDQRVLATWALKTAIVADFFGKEPYLPSSVYRQLFEKRCPPKTCLVFVSAYGGTDYKLTSHNNWMSVTTRNFWNRLGVFERGPVDMEGGMSTLRLLRLILQVAIFEREDAPLATLRKPSGYDEVIWPIADRPVAWPPSGKALDDSGVRAYSLRKKLVERKVDDYTGP